jgi:CheY-like chemotaxis protein
MKQHKILVVDDEKDLAKFIQLILSEDTSFDVITVSDSSKVLPTVLEWKPNLILLDIIMPGLQGNEIAEQIQESSELEGIKIIFITALVKKYEVNENGVIGGRRFLPKPIDADSLLLAVREELLIS